MKRIKVFIAYDAKIVRERVIGILSKINNIEIVGQADNGKETLKLIFKLHPEVALLGFNMPDMNGMAILTKIKVFYPDMKVILCNNSLNSDVENECLKRGADYFFQSECNNSLFDLLTIMKQIIDGLPKENMIKSVSYEKSIATG
ncbi:response regulator transcription factor [Candidatus Latescibacterota bacterium]